MYRTQSVIRNAYLRVCRVFPHSLSGESPFVSKTKYELLEEIMNEGVKFTQDIWSTVSDAGTLNDM